MDYNILTNVHCMNGNLMSCIVTLTLSNFWYVTSLKYQKLGVYISKNGQS